MLPLLLLSGLAFAAAPPERMAEAIRLHDAGKYEAAIDIYRAMLKERPHDPLIVYEMALSMVSRGKDFEAIIRFAESELASGVKQNPKLYVALATAYDSLGQLGKGEAALRRGLRVQPEDPNLQFNLGVNLSLQKNWVEASVAFLAAIAQAPDHATSWHGLARAMQELGNPMRAMLAWARFATLSRDKEKAQRAASEVWSLLSSRVQKDAKGTVRVSVDAKGNAPQESVGLGLIAAQRYLAEWKDQSDAAFFSKALRDVVQSAGELNAKDASWKVAQSFFGAALEKGHLEAMAYELRSIAGDAAAEAWLVDNASKVQAYRDWLAGPPRRR